MNEKIVREHWKKFAEEVLKAAQENVRFKKWNRVETKELISLLESESGELKSILDQLQILLAKIFTKDGTPRKKEVEEIVDGNTFSAVTALAVLETAFDSLPEYPKVSSPKGQAEKDISSDLSSITKYFTILDVLVQLYEKSAEAYTRRKFSMSALDFDDLQIMTMQLMRANENVRATLTSRFKHIMVDEFQDTNFLQYDIFLSLLNNFEGQARLFVVGDPKQSIYNLEMLR